MKRIIYIVILWMLVMLVNAATSLVAPLGTGRHGVLPPDSIPPDSLVIDSLLRDSLLRDSLSKLPSRGRLLSAYRNNLTPRHVYINPLDSIMEVRRRASDSIARLQEQFNKLQPIDSAIIKLDSVTPQSPLLDTLTHEKQNEIQDSLHVQPEPSDSLLPALPDAASLRGFKLSDDSLATDTVKKNDNALDFPVQYEAKDSTVYLPNLGFAHFYGESKVNYQQIELASEVISMSVDSSIVRAHGIADSLGVIQGKPVFKEGESQYTSETMSYNFKTKKGFITNVDTQQGDGFLTSERSKKGANDELYLEHGKYTTCDEEHPHFYLALSRAKVRPKKDVVFGPAWLVIEDVPLPFAVPFGFFPFNSTYSSGIIMPSYGDDARRGFYLRDGGYYFAISDYMDLKATGEIYTKGSWGVDVSSNYARRYKHRGSFSFNYQVYVTGEKNMPDYSKQKSFRIQWSHSQDSKASPNSTFSASVNYSTSSYDKNAMSSLYDPSQYAQSTKTSSVSYSRSFPSIGLTLSTSANVSMSSRDSSISMTLPDLNITLARFYPFKRKSA
ncbi:MAG: LPS-assembly protein LptD, partial [Bacteroidaceae bacterium]|nr:LPS-assembly protein LptD [Bacteroidaceae bacterium]